MEIFFYDLHFHAKLTDVKRVFANILHSPSYLPQSIPPWNFHVVLFPPKRGKRSGQAHGGCGIVTVPENELGLRLLGGFGITPQLSVFGRRIKLKPSRGTPSDVMLEKIRREPYISPEVQQRLAEIEQSFQLNTVDIQTVQLGWETRHGVFSVEWEKDYQDSRLAFNQKRREIRLRLVEQGNFVRSIVIHWSQISWSATGYADRQYPIIFFSLYSPPIFDIETSSSEKRQRVLELYPDDADLKRVLPYATLSIRLLCRGNGDLKTFRDHCKIARIPAPKDFPYRAEHLELFSEIRLEQFRQWTSTLDWSIAFQLEALLRGRLADTKEVLSISGFVDNMVQRKGVDYTENFLRSVINDSSFEFDGHGDEAFQANFKRYAKDFSWSPLPDPRNPEDGIFNCLHVAISPTSMKLGGPFPERSNRVMRTYAHNHDSFIRVNFVEETDLRYQQDREIDGPNFISRWVSPILREGITIAGRRFHFLAYSQSALRSHTVWFVKDFVDPSDEVITAAKIIERLGKFDGLEYDPKLIYCPARYAARISLAFTTTDSSISVPADEIFIRDDVISGRYCFTDGVGTISPQLARKIWRALQKRGPRSTRRAMTYPRAFQIRLVGAKGMLSVDHNLSGDVVILRRSMIKFDAPHSTDVEIAQAFVRPSKYYLNRSLIMVLEGLGVPYDVFKDLQDAAVQDVYNAQTSLEKAAKTLDQFGLAFSYRVSSTLLHLAKLGLSPDDIGDFYDQMILLAIHHILRDMKNRARIPVNDGDSYTLVGVADVHGYLEEDQVFACVTEQDSNSILYLEGPVLVSRSPIIHPGDVQVVHAIGRPLESPFDSEPLMNTIVFSIQGSRPLPSCLGGGDLDGDMYNVTSFERLHPPLRHPPAAYDPAPKKLLDRPSTIDDVADFVADYINSDVLGLVAINWLMMADYDNIFHEDCLKLCQIHSNAVDYPKSGTPVNVDTIPKPKTTLKPDWSAPETVNVENSFEYYPSRKAIGRLFRVIELPEVQTRNTAARWKSLHDDTSEPDLDEIFAALCMEDRQRDALESAVTHRVKEFINIEPNSEFVKLAIESLGRYSIELLGICACNTIQRRKAVLSEEEAVIGTIAAKCPQRRRRRDAMAQLREQTSYLVKSIRDELSGDDDSSRYDWLAKAWAAWKVSRQLKDRFGAHSYGWIALGEIFDAMKSIEQDETRRSRR
ncbi:RdRP-domain-containing protein [Russula earlei]|uniref:RdRP-domain-containing protein n=1 Tax=Russula earlei TaxID=71964 RepID=A0ACC0UPK4_9AGAM|nr:RdRP-domain-containing protein [Russula earlei]